MSASPTPGWHRFSLDRLAAQPWRNGRGATREIVCWPEGSGDAFDWRLSLATLEGDAPFSSFVGVERWFAIVSGGPVELRMSSSAHGPQPPRCLRLGTADPACRFDGASAVQALVPPSGAQALNLMLRRPRARGAMRRLADAQPCRAAGQGALLVCAGVWQIDLGLGSGSVALQPGEGVWWWGGVDRSLRAEPMAPADAPLAWWAGVRLHTAPPA